MQTQRQHDLDDDISDIFGDLPEVVKDEQEWPKINLPGWYNSAAWCRGCGRDASQTRVTYYAVDAIDHGPHLCDACRSPSLTRSQP